PEWRYWRDFVADNTSAFNLDALASTHPISVEAKSAEEASQRFDAISYAKGAAVLRMVEGYLGEEAFREGVRIYLRRHAEANASCCGASAGRGASRARDGSFRTAAGAASTVSASRRHSRAIFSTRGSRSSRPRKDSRCSTISGRSFGTARRRSRRSSAAS